MVKLPVSLSKAADAWREVSATVDQSAGLTLAGDADLVGLAQDKFSTGGMVPATWLGSLSEISGLASGPGEIMVVLVGAHQETEALEAIRRADLKGGVVLAVDEGSEANGVAAHPWKTCVRLSFSDTPAGWRQLFAACVNLAGDRSVALSRRHPVMRDLAAQRVIRRTAAQNALIGLIFMLPGADMPAMTLNQIKMMLQLSAIYGEKINVDRAIELLGIVALGLGFRGIARRFVSLVPGFGWIYKALIGYTGTTAVGVGAVKYFESGAPASTSRLVALAGSLRR